MLSRVKSNAIEGKKQCSGRAKAVLWKGKSNAMEGQKQCDGRTETMKEKK